MNNAASPRPDATSLQAQWLNTRMAGNPAWRLSMPPARQIIITERKVLVAWQLVAGQPQILDVFRAEKVDISFTAGLSLVLLSSTTGAPAAVSTYPREVLPGVFCWIPPFADVRFCPTAMADANSVWCLTVPMCVRPTKGQQLVHLSTSKEFRDRWPGVSF